MEIKNILEISEIFELSEKLNKIMNNKEEREQYFHKIVNAGLDLKTDFIRDLYQEEAAQRKQLKQDYTPDCLCNLFYQTATEPHEILDECAGTGSLAIEYINHGVDEITCIEKSKTVFPLLLMNMAIRNVSGYVVRGDIAEGEVYEIYKLKATDTYSDIAKQDNYEAKKYQTIISNPPYSLKWSGMWDERFFNYEMPPKSKADYLFVLDILYKLKEGGEAFVLLPHGVLFRGNQERTIRERVIQQGFIKGIIGLPDNMFLNTSIPTVLMCIKKDNQQNGIYIMDATGYATKGKKTNVLTEEALHTIAEGYKEKIEIPKIARMVSIKEIEQNEYNLNIPRYIDNFEEEEVPELKDIVSGIIAINNEIKVTENKLSEMMQNITGGSYQSDISEVIKLWS